MRFTTLIKSRSEPGNDSASQAGGVSASTTWWHTKLPVYLPRWWRGFELSKTALGYALRDTVVLPAGYQLWLKRVTDSFTKPVMMYRELSAWVSALGVDLVRLQPGRISYAARWVCSKFYKQAGEGLVLSLVDRYEGYARGNDFSDWLLMCIGYGLWLRWSLRQVLHIEADETLREALQTLSWHHNWLGRMTSQQAVLYRLVEDIERVELTGEQREWLRRHPLDWDNVMHNPSVQSIGRAYRQLALRFHPDKTGGEDELFKLLKSAKLGLDELRKAGWYTNLYFVAEALPTRKVYDDDFCGAYLRVYDVINEALYRHRVHEAIRMRRQLAAKNQALLEKETVISKKETVISEKETVISKKNAEIARLQAIISKKNAEIARLRAMRAAAGIAAPREVSLSSGEASSVRAVTEHGVFKQPHLAVKLPTHKIENLINSSRLRSAK